MKSEIKTTKCEFFVKNHYEVNATYCEFCELYFNACINNTDCYFRKWQKEKMKNLKLKQDNNFLKWQLEQYSEKRCKK